MGSPGATLIQHLEAGKAVLSLLIKSEWPHLRADQCESLIKWVQARFVRGGGAGGVGYCWW